MPSVLAIDPGVTTGFVMVALDENTITMQAEEVKLSHNDLFILVSGFKPEVTICESFEYRPRARDNVELYSRELIGVLNLCEQRGVTRLTMQTAAEGKGYFTDAKLKELGIYKKGKGHHRDAIRHFMQWFTFKEGYKYNNGQELFLVNG